MSRVNKKEFKKMRKNLGCNFGLDLYMVGKMVMSLLKTLLVMPKALQLNWYLLMHKVLWGVRGKGFELRG